MAVVLTQRQRVTYFKIVNREPILGGNDPRYHALGYS